MKLFYSEFSPFVRKVRVIAAEKGVPLELIKTAPFDDDAEFLRANPLSKIPALITDDGVAYSDSSVICEYLDVIAPTPPLYPADKKERLAVLQREYLALGILDATVKLTIESRRPEGTRWEKFIERQKNSVLRTCAVLEKEAASFNSSYTDMITLACAIGYIEIRHSRNINWREGNPNLTKWYSNFCTRKSFVETEPDEAKAA